MRYTYGNDGQVSAPSRERAPVWTQCLEVPVVTSAPSLSVVEAVYRDGAYRCPHCGKVLALSTDHGVASRCGRARWFLAHGRQEITCWGSDCGAIVVVEVGASADAA